MRLLCRRAGDPDRVGDEDPDQHDRVDQRDRVLQRQGQGVDGRDREERDLDPVRTLEADLGSRLLLQGAPLRGGERSRRLPGTETADLVPGQEDDHRPPDPDQQPVGAGHVRERERARGRVGVAAGRGARGAELLHGVPRLRGEHEIDRVLGQHRDEGEHRDREAGGDVQLRDLRGPGEEERGPHDRHPEQERLERVGQRRVGEPQDDGGDRDRARRREVDALPGGMDVVEVVVEGRHTWFLAGRCGRPRGSRRPPGREPSTGPAHGPGTGRVLVRGLVTYSPAVGLGGRFFRATMPSFSMSA